MISIVSVTSLMLGSVKFIRGRVTLISKCLLKIEIRFRNLFGNILQAK